MLIIVLGAQRKEGAESLQGGLDEILKEAENYRNTGQKQFNKVIQ